MAEPDWTFTLSDTQTDTLLVDVTGEVTVTLQRRLNRPNGMVVSGFADRDWVKTIAFDGDRYLSAGTRVVKAYRNSVFIAANEVWLPQYVGDTDRQTVSFNSYDPMARMVSRSVYDDDGRVADWNFPVGISAGPFVQEIFANSVTYEDAETGLVVAPPPAPFPIDFASGLFTASVDVTEQLTDGPLTMGELLYTRLADLGVCDIVLTATDTAHGSSAGVIGVLNAVTEWGTDRTASVHFDYDTGDHSIAAINRSFDFSTVCNRLRYLLGPKIGSGDHWKGSIEASDAATLGTLDYLLAEYLSRAKYGTLANYRVYDTDANEAALRALYDQLFITETTLRVAPRELLDCTPSTDAPYKPFDDYDIGDIVAVNTSDNIGPAITNGAQRLYGFDVTIDDTGREIVGKFVTSADGVTS